MFDRPESSLSPEMAVPLKKRKLSDEFMLFGQSACERSNPTDVSCNHGDANRTKRGEFPYQNNGHTFEYTSLVRASEAFPPCYHGHGESPQQSQPQPLDLTVKQTALNLSCKPAVPAAETARDDGDNRERKRRFAAEGERIHVFKPAPVYACNTQTCHKENSSPPLTDNRQGTCGRGFPLSLYEHLTQSSSGVNRAAVPGGLSNYRVSSQGHERPAVSSVSPPSVTKVTTRAIVNSATVSAYVPADAATGRPVSQANAGLRQASSSLGAIKSRLALALATPTELSAGHTASYPSSSAHLHQATAPVSPRTAAIPTSPPPSSHLATQQPTGREETVIDITCDTPDISTGREVIKASGQTDQMLQASLQVRDLLRTWMNYERSNFPLRKYQRRCPRQQRNTQT